MFVKEIEILTKTVSVLKMNSISQDKIVKNVTKNVRDVLKIPKLVLNVLTP